MAKETLILDELVKTREAVRMDAEDRLNVQEVNKHLHSALEKLTPRQKLVYTLSRDKGLKHDEIARFLGISPSTVNNHLIEALRLIRQQLSARPEAFTIFISCFRKFFIENHAYFPSRLSIYKGKPLNMLRERLLYLMERYFKGACTDEERKELAQYIHAAQDDGLLKEVLDSTWSRFQPEGAYACRGGRPCAGRTALSGQQSGAYAPP